MLCKLMIKLAKPKGEKYRLSVSRVEIVHNTKYTRKIIKSIRGSNVRTHVVNRHIEQDDQIFSAILSAFSKEIGQVTGLFKLGNVIRHVIRCQRVRLQHTGCFFIDISIEKEGDCQTPLFSNSCRRWQTIG